MNDANNLNKENHQEEIKNSNLKDAVIPQSMMNLGQNNSKIETKVESIQSDIPIILKAVPIEEASKDKEIIEIEKKNKKKNRSRNNIVKWILLVGLLLIVFGIVLQLLPINNQSINNQATAKDFAGIYKNSKGKAYLYTKDGKEVIVTIELSNYSFMNQEEVKDGKLSMKTIEDKTTITLSKDKKTIFIVSDFKEINNTSFKKEKDYTKEDFYQNNYGDLKLLDNKYNGIFKLDNKEIRIYQKDEETIRALIEENNSSMDIEFKIMKENTLEGEVLEDKYIINLEDDSIIFNTVNGDNNFDGTYEKVGKQTIDDILNSYY